MKVSISAVGVRNKVAKIVHCEEPRCDCTINESQGNCSGIVTCPKEGTDAEIESGGAQ